MQALFNFRRGYAGLTSEPKPPDRAHPKGQSCGVARALTSVVRHALLLIVVWGGISFGTGVVSQARGGKPRGDWDSGRIKAGADLRQISSEVRKNRADLQLI